MGLFGRQEPKVCWVRSATDNPCGQPATVEIQGVPFCERCAREQEDYAAIGALTDGLAKSDLGSLREASLTESLKRLRRERASRIALRGTSHRGQKV